MLNYKNALWLFLALNLLFLLGKQLFCLPFYLGFFPVVFFLSACFYGSICVGSNFYLKVVCRLPSDKKVVCLTFDDGPHEYETTAVLDVLARHQVKASFFVVGKKAEEQEAVIQRMISDGHVLGNHSYRHHYLFPLMLPGAIASELQATYDFIRQHVPAAKHYFRPPFGVTNPMISRAVKKLSPQLVGWSLRSFDTILLTKPERLLKRLLRKTRPGDVVLLHDRLPGIHKVLDTYISELKKQGYSFATIESLDQNGQRVA